MSSESHNDEQVLASESTVPAQTHGKSRRKAVLIGMLAVIALVGAGLTSAFTVHNTAADNVLTFGNVRLEIIQQEKQADGSLKDVPADYEVKAASGLASRIVTFQNAGESDLYVRARPVMRAESAAGEDRGDASQVTKFQMVDSGDWIQKSPDDGWYYYVGGEKGGLVAAATGGSETGDATEPLMNGIEFVGDFSDVVGPNGRFVFTVEAQAVQADNNGESALDAMGWPEEGAQE